MAISRRFQIFAILIVGFFCTNNVVQGKGRHQPSAEASSENADILKSAGSVLEAGSPNDIEALANAVTKCVTNGNKKRQNDLVSKSYEILSVFVDADLAAKTIVEPQVKRSLVSEEEFNERGAMQDISTILKGWQVFLDLLDETDRRQYQKAYAAFLNAPSNTQRIYVVLMIKYAEKCANGEDFGLRATARRTLENAKRFYQVDRY